MNAPSQARPVVLAIDDTPANLMVLASALSKEFSFQLASSGTQGLELARSVRPSLVMLDIMMPGMDGYETCSLFKADANLCHIPIIFVTALSETDAEIKGLELGAADYLCKPINVAIARQRIRNLIEREALRQEVSAHRDRLEEMVAARTVELVRAREAAEAASQAKSIFLGNMSHEFRTPLGIMLGMNYLLQKQLDDQKLKDKCNKIAQAGVRLQGLIQNVLDVTRIHWCDVSLSSEAFSPEALLSLVIERMRLQAQVKLLDLTPIVDPQLPNLLTGASLTIKHILELLVANAIKFSNNGAIQIRAELETPTEATQWVRFSVADHGIGIGPEQIERIFGLFTQVDESNTRTHGGLGVGLYLCAQLTKALGGEIGVDSELGHGSLFWIRFPLHNGALPTLSGVETPASMPYRSSHAGGQEELPATIAQQLQSLLELVRNSDFDALALWEREQPVLAGYLQQWAKPFDQAMENCDFAKAGTYLQNALIKPVVTDARSAL